MAAHSNTLASQLGPESPVLGLSSAGGGGLGPLWSRLPSGAKKLLRPAFPAHLRHQWEWGPAQGHTGRRRQE